MDQKRKQGVKPESGGGLGFSDVRRAVYRRLKAVAALPFAVAMLAAAIGFALPTRYDATATIQIDPRPKLSATSISELVGATPEPVSVDKEIETLRSAPVIDLAVARLGLQSDPEFRPSLPTRVVNGILGRAASAADIAAEVGDGLTIARVRNTLLITVRFSSREADKSARIANAIADAYLEHQAQEKRQEIGGDATSAGIASASERVFRSLVEEYGQGVELSGARVVSQATAAMAPSSPKRLKLVITAFLVSLAAAVTLALVLELRDAAGTAGQNVQKALACPHMTSVPALPADDKAEAANHAARLIVAKPACHYAEAVRGAWRELQRQNSGARSRVVLVVSALPGEGAELLASNIAHHVAITGDVPLLVDADLRTKSLTRRLSATCRNGLLDQIASHGAVEDAILRDGVTGLHFLPASGPAPTPIQIPSVLRSSTFAEAVADLRERFGTIIVAAPPMLEAIDARIIADIADQIVFVMAWEKTPRALAQKAIASLGANQKKVSGAVLTDIHEGSDASMMSFADILSEIRRAAHAFDAHAA